MSFQTLILYEDLDLRSNLNYWEQFSTPTPYSQIDLINKSQSGLIKSRDILKNLDEIKIIEFDHTDVVRHPLVSKIIRAFQKKNSDDKN